MTDPKGLSGAPKKTAKTKKVIVRTETSSDETTSDKKSLAVPLTSIHHGNANGNGNGNGGKPELPKLAEAMNKTPEERAVEAQAFKDRQKRLSDNLKQDVERSLDPDTVKMRAIHEAVTANVANTLGTKNAESVSDISASTTTEHLVEKEETVKETYGTPGPASSTIVWKDHKVPIFYGAGVILFLIIIGLLIYKAPRIQSWLQSDKPNAAVSSGKVTISEKVTAGTTTVDVTTTTGATDDVMPPGGLVGAGPSMVVTEVKKTPAVTAPVPVVKTTSTSTTTVQSAPSVPTTVTTTVKSKDSVAKVEVKRDPPQAVKLKEKKVVSSASTAYLPMARKGEIDNPKMLAARIRESLKRDSSGNGDVRGANISPKGFLLAITMAGGTLDGVEALPVYLDSLVEGDMPQGSITMSRVVETRSTSGQKKTELDVKKGYAREARMGERGWYDANTGNLILAGDCSNSPLGQVKGPVAPPPKPALVVAAKPAPVYTPPPVVAQAPVPAFQGCVEGKYLRINIWDKGALDVSGVRSMIEETRRETNSQFKPSRISRTYWKQFLDMEKVGTLKRASSTHIAEVWVDHNGTKIPVWNGTVHGGVQRIPMPLSFVEGSVLRVTFLSSVRNSLESPLETGLHVAHREYKDVSCGFNFNVVAIER